MTARWVRQEDRCGCAIACLAMVTGQTYQQVKSAWPTRVDFAENGLDPFAVSQYLGDRGIAHIFRYRFLLGRNGVAADGTDYREIRPGWPSSFAPIHIIGTGIHDVVLLPDGTVLDPMQEQPRRLADVGEVSFMIGVWPRIHLEPEEGSNGK